VLQKDSKEADTFVAENSLHLPLGYTYESMISETDFRELPLENRQEVLTKAIVLDNVSTTLSDLSFESKSIPFEIVNSEGVVFEENRLKVKKKDASFRLKFNAQENCELYIKISNFGNKNKKSSAITKITIPECEKTVSVRENANTYTINQKDYLINLGYYEKSMDEITILINNKGTYSLDSLEIICLPVEKISSQLTTLQKDALSNIEIESDGIKGSIKLEKPKLLCLSIPYSNGWKAYIDNREVDIKKGNLMFLAIEVPEGEHLISLKYHIPGVLLGAAFSLLSLLILFIMCIKAKIYKNKSICLEE
jgi:uncharacterized membrane protein YfhO